MIVLGLRRTRPIMDRFMGKVEIMPSGCWEWRAHIKNGGYGDFRYPGGRFAHRASYELFVGPIPEGLQLDHLCRVRHCVNPDHLEPVTGAVNVQRAKDWTKCEVYHPGQPSRFSMRGRGSDYCRECGRIREANRRAARAA